MLAATGSPSGSGWSGGPEADNVVAGGTGHGLEQHPVVEDVEQLGVDPDSEQLPGPGGAHAELLAGHGDRADLVHLPGHLDRPEPPWWARIGWAGVQQPRGINPGRDGHGLEQQPVLGDLQQAGRHPDSTSVPASRRPTDSQRAPRRIVPLAWTRRHTSLVPSVTAIVPDDQGAILLVHKTDNDLWALTGGGMDVGESMADAVVREVIDHYLERRSAPYIG